MDQYSFCSFPFPISLENNSKTTPCRLSQTAALSLSLLKLCRKLEALKKKRGSGKNVFLLEMDTVVLQGILLQ